MRGPVADKVIESIAVALKTDTEAVSAAMHLQGQLGVDSLDRCNIVLELEENFVVKISDREADAWQTVADVIATVENGGLTHAS